MKKTLTCFFFVPGLSEKYRTGGLLVIKDIAAILEKQCEYRCEFVATHEKNIEAKSPEEIFAHDGEKNGGNFYDAIFIVTWGPLVGEHVALIRKNVPHARIFYYAQSFGWNIKIPNDIPIICVSRFVTSQWALHAPGRFCVYIPPPLDPCFALQNSARPIDVLVHTRKQNPYCLDHLVPALTKENLNVEIIENWIPREAFAKKMQQTKIFLYITQSHKAGLFRRLPAEGFGMPALEALACGAVVGSNLLGGVTDFLTPGENCIKLENGDTAFDVSQIRDAVKGFSVDEAAAHDLGAYYSPQQTARRWSQLFEKHY